MNKCVRYESAYRICGWPLLAVAQGPTPDQRETRGHAKGVIAIGDVATGFIAVGGVAQGLIAIGGLAVGLVTVAGVGAGALVIAGVAFAQTAFGGVAFGQYAKGGVTIGAHVVSPERIDHSAAEWFGKLGLHSQSETLSKEYDAAKPAH
jgi:hypothetical protein